jgi:26S proteasome regulatory subunit N1
LVLVRQIIPYNMKHNAEAEACDLLMEIEQLQLLEQYVDEGAYSRVCLYLTSCVPYVPDPENTILLETSLKLFLKFKQLPHALRLAMQLNDMEQIRSIFLSCPDP